MLVQIDPFSVCNASRDVAVNRTSIYRIFSKLKNISLIQFETIYN